MPTIQRSHLILCGIFFITLIWSGIEPRDRLTWYLEVAPAVFALILLAAIYNRFRFSTFTYSLILAQCIILMIGGHTTYAEVPLFNWLRDTFGLARNYYDRVGHFAQGFVPAMIMREVVIRKNLIRGRFWQPFFTVMTVLGFSAFYEFFEWWAALMSGEAANAFLGTQGDVWDTQWDMFTCLIGSVTSLTLLGKVHDKYLTQAAGQNTQSTNFDKLPVS